MPFPDKAFRIYGGCKCDGVSYTISVPQISERPLHATSAQSPVDKQCRQSFSFICLCEDCRRASGMPFYMGIAVNINYVSVLSTASGRNSFSPNWKNSGDGVIPRQGNEDAWYLPGSHIFTSNPHPSYSTLAAYESSPNTFRYFCSKCGTHIGLMAMGSQVLDICTGTLCEPALEEGSDAWLKPERILRWGKGPKWVLDMLDNGANDMVKHPGGRKDEYV